MPHITEHGPMVSNQSINSYDREISREKATARQTHAHRRIVQNHFSGRFDDCTVGHKSHDPRFHVFLMEAGVMTFVTHCTLYIPNPVLSQTRFFARCQYFHET